MRISKELQRRARKIKVILMDVDGVLTRGDIVYDSNGLEIKHFNAHDGLGIRLARLSGLQTGILSLRESGTIRTRAAELKIDHLLLGKEKKLPAFEKLRNSLNLAAEEFCFIGDDYPDIPVMRVVGLAVAVQNASQLTKKSAHYVTRKGGGDGAVREVIEIILQVQNRLQPAIAKV
jgi:3-deoxy-D-manno-octulosonate 8-phosphate phosphatase (KDO 8-P phosphatase)